MKKKYLLTFISLIVFILVSLTGYSQEVTLIPSDLTPEPEGYYVKGIYKDLNNDGIEELYNGCSDFYEDEPPFGENGYDPSLNHKETGIQQGFSYFNCMIMPTCSTKGTVIDPPVAEGWIQMHACIKSTVPDSAIFSYIQTPSVSNLTSFTIETSADVSVGDHRKVVYNLEYSKDQGTTWEETYVQESILVQGGHRVTYDGQVYLEIQEMIDASKVSPIVIRIITNDREASPTGQFVKLHSFVLEAEKATGLRDVELNNQLDIRIVNQTIISENEEIEVYNLLGQFVGSGNLVQLPQTGVYLVKNNKNITQKVFIR